MYDALKEYPYPRVWILDRCTDNSEAQLKELGERYQKTKKTLKGRQTSHARNLGLAACSPGSDVLFLDGDRYPVKGTLCELETWEKDIALLLLAEKDPRESVYDYPERVYGRVYSGFYSPGLFMRRNAIDKVLEFQSGELFSAEMQEEWGIEDVYLGDVCYHLELTADIYRSCFLQGFFAKNQIESIGTVAKRFRKRDLLNVWW
jgi:hypothetical protein